jgi:DNA-binding NarL/FixJ family response regulator
MIFKRNGGIRGTVDCNRGLAILCGELEALPEIKRVYSWTSAEDFWRDRKGRGLDVLFLDIRLPAMDGVELAGMVSERNTDTNIVMLSSLNADGPIFQALRNGACGYILKEEFRDIPATVRTILAGGAIITPTIAVRVLGSFRKSGPIKDARLTPRETEILEFMVKGNTLPETAEHLGTSLHTVRSQAKSIYAKLNVHNRAQLARAAAASGLL